MFLLIPSLPALACSPGVNNHFDIDFSADIKWSSHLYPPIINNTRVERGIGPCYFATVTIEVELPPLSFYKLYEVGFYVIHENSKRSNYIFPNFPTAAQQSKDGKFYISFQWLDTHRDKALNIPFSLITVLKDSTISAISKTKYLKSN